MGEDIFQLVQASLSNELIARRFESVFVAWSIFGF